MSNLPACRRSYWRLQVVLCIVVLGSIFLAACGNGNSGAGLSRDEVEQIVRTEMAQFNPPPTDESGISDKVAEDAVREAIAAIARTEMGLARKEVEELVEDEIARIAEFQTGLIAAAVEGAIRKTVANMSRSEAGLNRNEVEQIVQAAIAGISEPQGGLTTSEAESIARGVVASIPPKSAPADYTRFFVSNAVSRYETQGLDATLAHYNREESVDGQWYVFIIDENDLVIGHPDSGRLGLDLNGWVGTDANGYNFGPEILSATEQGKWVSYVYRNPETVGSGEESRVYELKNVWVVRHDNLLFCSGWYISSDDFTRHLVSIAVERFRTGGLEATVAYFASPGSALAGLETAISYYNSAETVDGKWSAFIAADEGGNVVAHSDPAMIGKSLQEIFGAASFESAGEGRWVTSESLRMWVAESGGLLFGSGWHHDVPGS